MKPVYPFILLLLISFQVRSQSPPWFFINTGVENTHVVLVLPQIPMTIDGNPLQIGDYIGAFYEVGTLEFCGTGTGNTGDMGGMPITGQNYAATNWGASTPTVFNGFQIGEEFRWKVWRSSDGSVFDAIATYDLTIPGISDSGLYAINGISALASLTALSIPGKNISVNEQISPVSGCFLTNLELIEVVLQNHDTLPVSGFDIFLSLNNGQVYSSFVTDTIQAGAYLNYLFDTVVDLSLNGDYFFHVWVELAGDVNLTNDYNKKTITHFLKPEVNLGDDIYICEGDTVILFPDTVFDSYLWNTGEEGYYIFASDPGLYIITVSDGIDCPGIDTLIINHFPKPQIVLRDTIMYCENGYANIKIQERFFSFKWSNGLQKPSLYITFPGTYTVTVQDFAGCFWQDSVVAIEVPIPQLDLGPDIYTNSPDTVMLDAGNSALNYLWSTGETSASIQITSYGNYLVTISVGTCTNQDNILILNEEQEPEEPEEPEEFNYRFHHNLTLNQVLIKLYKPDKDELTVFNQLGQFIQKYQLINTDNYISLNYLQPGIYYFRLKVNGKEYVEKVVKL